MKWETENPTLVKLIGACIALLAIVAASTVAKDHASAATGVATFILGVIGVQVGQKSGDS